MLNQHFLSDDDDDDDDKDDYNKDDHDKEDICVCVPLFAVLLNVLLLPFTKVASQIDRSQKESLGKS